MQVIEDFKNKNNSKQTASNALTATKAHTITHIGKHKHTCTTNKHTHTQSFHTHTYIQTHTHAYTHTAMRNIAAVQGCCWAADPRARLV